MNIYVASSWRNEYQPTVVTSLREVGYEVYDFKNPSPGDTGFHWSDIDEDYEQWTAAEYVEALNHPIAQVGYQKDFMAMTQADACVLVLPCGRSAHLEAGWFAGSPDKKLIILLDEDESTLVVELMNKMADAICLDLAKVIETLDEWGGRLEI
jgi:hypothetical protein